MMNRTGEEWYEHQKRFDAQTRQASEKIAGAERRIFVYAMNVIANCYDRAVSLQPVPDDLATKRKLGLTIHAFNLLWSAWDSVLAGRSDAAANHWRSIEEIPDFLMALMAEPDCAGRWDEPTWNIHAARRVVRNGMDVFASGTGREWLTQKRSAAKGVQPLSHVSMQAQGLALGIGTLDGAKIGVLRPGGAPSFPILLNTARYLAASAVGMAMSVACALAMVPGLSDLWDEDVTSELQSWAAAVPTETPAGSRPGEVEQLILLRSDEEPPDPASIAERTSQVGEQ